MFTLVWRDGPLDALADAYVTADPVTRDAIERAVTRLNNRLWSNPHGVGESRPGRGRRIAHETPCAIRFTAPFVALRPPAPPKAAERRPTARAAREVRVTSFWTY